MLSWLNKKTGEAVVKYHQPLTWPRALQYALMMALGTLISCGIRFFPAIPLPAEIIAPPQEYLDIIFRVLIAPTTEEFITRVILIYFIGTLISCGTIPHTPGNTTKKIILINRVIVAGAIISALLNGFFLMQDCIDQRSMMFAGYLLFLGTAMLLFRRCVALRGLIFFIFLFGSCFLFAALHPSRQLFMAYLAFALLNSYWTIKTRSIVMPIVMHVYINVISTILIFV
jgi:hypothetical protein